MHFKQGYKICIHVCLVIQGSLRLFGNYKGLVLFFRKVSLDATERFTNVRISLIPHSIRFLNPQIFENQCENVKN